jgi:site-specific recombinase XerD
MLEYFFDNPVALGRLQRNPLRPHLESFAVLLSSLRYTASTARPQLEFLSVFGRWLVQEGIAVTDLDEEIIDSFFGERRRQGLSPRYHASTVRRFLEHLRNEGIVPLTEPVTDESPLALLTSRYEKYLREERGLSTATVKNYMPFVCRLLTERFGDGPLCLQELGPGDISDFILRHAHSKSPKRAKMMSGALRSFFRFLFQHEEIEINLSVSVPSVPNWRLATVPKHLTSEEIERLLKACDRSTSTGRRNYAILLLLVRFGLRAGEVVNMELDDIDWRAGEIMIRGKGLLHDRLPLPADVGEALADYLRYGRPQCSTRRLFICAKAPRRGFTGPGAISSIVRRTIDRAGLDPPIKGAYLLRHSLATEMLRRGASMSEIGEVLRHRVPSTTEIYAKVDFHGLRSLAQPWPEKGGG